MRGQAVVAAVLRGYGDRDHLALELGEAGRREHQVVVEGRERLKLGVVERIGEQHVRHEAELLAALFEESRLQALAGDQPMNIQGQFATDEDRAARRLIERAGIIIKSARGDVPESFAPLMFAGVPTEDLARYEARELAELAEAAW